MADNLKLIMTDAFRFLETEYGFKLIKSKKESLFQSILYMNTATAVELVFEYRESYLFVKLYQLVNGVFIDDPVIIREDTVLHGYGLDDVILLRNPSALIGSTYQFPKESNYHDPLNGWSYYINDYAVNLNKYAFDILRGDFTIFPELEKVVKKRLAEYRDHETRRFKRPA